jgi:inward rectifier potassium channel
MAKTSFGRKLAQIRGKSDAPEFGFGSITNSQGKRMLQKDGGANVIRLGEPRYNILNIYHSLVTITWLRFNIYVFIFYFSINSLFTLAYYIATPDGLGGMSYSNELEKIEEIFFFSAQSLTTVGYGRLNPVSTTASGIAALESMIGLLGFALATGLLYGRFSRPTAKLLYSDNVLIAPYNNVKFPGVDKALMFRILNARSNQLIEVEAQVLFAYNEEVNGNIIRRFQALKLEIEKISLLALSWTIVHPITEESPLFGVTQSELESVNAEFMINLKAIDDTYVQQVYTRTSYNWEELVWDAKFNSIISKNEQGIITVDLKKISTYTKLA